MSASWQQDLDEVLDVDTSLDLKREKAKILLEKIRDIASDVGNAAKDRDFSKLAPIETNYGKAIQGLKAFKSQLRTDIIPDFVTRQLPKLVQEAPNVLKEVINKTPEISVTSFMENIKELSEEDIRKEIKSIFKTPEDLYSPPFTVLKTTQEYEVRKYDAYTVAQAQMNDEDNIGSILVSGNSFNTLASYIFGNNTKSDGVGSEKMSMTTPVIMTEGQMEFVLPKNFDASTSPTPKSSKVTVKDVSEEIVAVKAFTGIVTDKEITIQRSSLEDALLADGITYDNLSFKVLQYNPPYSLPWIRRNEVSLKVTADLKELIDEDITDDMDGSPIYYTSPEAGE